MAKGNVSTTNPPEISGKIKMIAPDGTEQTYNYNVKAGDTVDGYMPKVGDRVEFTPHDPSKVATDVTRDQGCRIRITPALVDAGNVDVAIKIQYDTGLKATKAKIDPQVGEVAVGIGVANARVSDTTQFTLYVEYEDGTHDQVTGIVIFQ